MGLIKIILDPNQGNIKFFNFNLHPALFHLEVNANTFFNQSQPPEVIVKKAFLEISENSQGNTCASVSLTLNMFFPV